MRFARGFANSCSSSLLDDCKNCDCLVPLPIPGFRSNSFLSSTYVVEGHEALAPGIDEPAGGEWRKNSVRTAASIGAKPAGLVAGASIRN